MAAESEFSVILQTGPITPPDSLIRNLQTIPGTSIDARRIGLSFIGGGVGSFIKVTTTTVNIAPMSGILYRHTQRLKDKDNLVILSGARIKTAAEEVTFRDVQCQKQVPLKGKSEDEIKEILMEESG